MRQPRFITPKMRRDMSIVPADYWRALRQGFNPDKPLTLAVPLFQPVMTVNATRAELAAKRASAFLKHYTDNPPKTGKPLVTDELTIGTEFDGRALNGHAFSYLPRDLPELIMQAAAVCWHECASIRAEGTIALPVTLYLTVARPPYTLPQPELSFRPRPLSLDHLASPAAVRNALERAYTFPCQQWWEGK